MTAIPVGHGPGQFSVRESSRKIFVVGTRYTAFRGGNV